MTIAAGSRLGPYEIVARIGAGGMGEVWKARDTRLGRLVALKLLAKGFMPDSEARQRFAQEARTISALNEPHIVTIYDIGFDNGVDYIAMELVDGETVRDLLAGGRLELRRSLHVVAQAAAGLATAHAAGVIHRDVKPENIMVNRSSQVKILDFGLAKMEEKARASILSSGELTAEAGSGGHARTSDGTILGTVSYMSPEQASGRPLDNRTDIFSLGLVLYELLTGRKAFSGASIVETLHAIIHDQPPAAIKENARIPRGVLDVLEKSIAKDPNDRYRHAGDLELDLRRTLQVMDSGGSPAIVSRERRGSAGRIVRVIAAALLALAAGFAGWRYGHSSARSATTDSFGEGSVTPLTTDPGYEGEPTFSPDGQTVAYVADREGNFEIYLQQISGGPALNLTRNPAADIQPAFSPDGHEIAFVSGRASATDVFHASPNLPLVGGDIWVMPALGGAPRRIAENGNSPSWTPDGTGVLYVHGTFRNCRIARVSSSGGERRDIPIEEPSVQRYFYPSLSADGRWLLYQNGGQIEVVDANGGKPRVLAQGQSPAWGFASNNVLFTNGTPGKGRTLWQAPFSRARGELQGPPRPITFGRGADIDAKASRDGSTIVFSSVDETLNLQALPFDAESGRATGTPRDLTSGNNQIGFLDPAPDGNAVVFGATLGAESHLWRVDATAKPVQLTLDPKYSETDPAFSPDGREILFARRGNEGSRASASIWVMKADGTGPRLVYPRGTGRTAWLPDGKHILIQEQNGLIRFDLASGAAAPLAGADSRTLFTLDPSGGWIAFQRPEGEKLQIAAIPSTGGTRQLVATGPYDGYHPLFSPSGRWVYFQPDHKNLFRVPGPGQNWAVVAPERVTDFSGVDLYMEDPKISRDGKTLFYTRGRRTGDVFILNLSRNLSAGGSKAP